MKRKTAFVFALWLTVIALSACTSDYSINKLPYSVEVGAYGFDKAVTTDLITKEVSEMLFDDVLYDNDWRWTLSFSIGITQDTKFIYNRSSNAYVVLNGGNAYELIENNTLKLHFPRWEGYDYEVYDVVIILGKHKLYG